jgi:hypothetical protein
VATNKNPAQYIVYAGVGISHIIVYKALSTPDRACIFIIRYLGNRLDMPGATMQSKNKNSGSRRFSLLLIDNKYGDIIFIPMTNI